MKAKKIALATSLMVLGVSAAFAASDVQLSQGVEIELVDINSSIFMGQDYNFTNVTVYGSAVEFTNNSVSNNISVKSNTSTEINSTLDKYDLDSPDSGTEVFKIETSADSSENVNVTFDLDASSISNGEYHLDVNGNSLDTFSTGNLWWDYQDWDQNSGNNTFTVAYTGTQASLSWSDNSDNENGFRIYSNATGSMSEIKTVGADTTSTTDTTSLDSGETVKYKVTAYNQFGESTGTTDTVNIP